MRDFSDALADDSRELGEELLLYTVDRLTDEMEIPYQFDWVVGVTLRKQNHGATVKDLAYESFNEFTEKIAKGLGYEYELSPTWYEDYKSDEFTIFQAFSVLRAKRLSNEELFLLPADAIPPLYSSLQEGGARQSCSIQYHRYQDRKSVV